MTPSAYPGALDSIATDKSDTTEQGAGDHSGHHNLLADAINKIEAELGIQPRGASATVKARLDAIATALGTKVDTGDARLSDSRTPTAHATSHAAAGSDPLTLTQAQVTGLVAALALLAPLASPTFTGDPKAPTPAGGDNDTSVATTAFVQGELAAKAPLASPTFTGDPKAPTPAQGDNDTSIATTAYVQTETGLLVPKSLVDAKGDLLVGTADNTVARKAAGSRGQVLTSDSSSADGLAWLWNYFWAVQVGKYLTPQLAANPTFVNPGSTANLIYVPLIVPRLMTFDRISTSVNTTATTGTARLGIFGVDSDGILPGAMLYDFGTVSLTTSGIKEITINQQLAPGIYFSALQVEYTGGPPTLLGTPTGGLSNYSAFASLAGGKLSGWVQSNTGALPANASGLSDAGQAPFVALRRSA